MLTRPSVVNAAACVLLNPAAAGGRAGLLEPALRAWLARHAPHAPLVVPGDAQASRAWLAERPPGQRCVLVGGDGTVHQMLPALLQGGHSLGLVPLGSGNDTARALGVHGLPWQHALGLALASPATPVDLGELETAAGTRPFISSLAAGFDAAVGLRALHGPAWLRGLPRYLWATFGELARLQRHGLTVEVDDATLHQGPAIFASVLNTPSYGSGMPAVPAARVDDGRLDVLVAGRFGRAAALAMLPRLLAGRHLGDARIQTLSFTRLRISSDRSVPLATDGEPAGCAEHWEVRVLPQALQVVKAAAHSARQSMP